jgi:hypothetical protein
MMQVVCILQEHMIAVCLFFLLAFLDKLVNAILHDIDGFEIPYDHGEQSL